MSKKLQLDAKLNVDKAVAQVCQAKSVKQQQPLLREGGEGLSHNPVGEVQKGFGQQNAEPPDKLKQNSKVQSTQ